MAQEDVFWEEQRETAVVDALDAAADEPVPSEDDEEAQIRDVLAFFARRDLDHRRLAGVIRQALDDALDGSRTGRYDIAALNKVEKTFVGMRVELGLSQVFNLEDGDSMDFKIAGHDVDAKFSFNRNGWYIPPEAVGHLCLVLWADDRRSKYQAGVVLITRERLNIGRNRDKKVTLSEAGRDAIRWIVEDGDLPENLLLHLPEVVHKAVWVEKAGQARVDALFRNVQRTIIPRVAVETAAKQTDPAKRARDSRRVDRLGADGILILGGDYHVYAEIARGFGLPEPGPGQWLSVRVAPSTPGERGAQQIGEGWWRLATNDDPYSPAPTISTKKAATPG